MTIQIHMDKYTRRSYERDVRSMPRLAIRMEVGQLEEMLERIDENHYEYPITKSQLEIAQKAYDDRAADCARWGIPFITR